MKLWSTDIEAQAFGHRISHTRTFGNRIVSNLSGGGDDPWLVNQYLSYVRVFELQKVDGDTYYFYAIYLNSNDIFWFGSLDGVDLSYAFFGNYRIKAPVKVPEIGDIHVWMPDGREFVYYGMPGEALKGRLMKVIEKDGLEWNFSYDESQRLAAATISDQGVAATFGYTWTTSGVQRIETLTFSLGGAMLSRALYSYYTGETAQGSSGDLQRVRRQRYSAATGGMVNVGDSYYTYYKSGEDHGSRGLVKYVLEAEAMRRVDEALLDPATASDVQLSTFADYYFEYDQSRRVTRESLRGGAYTHTFEYLGRGAGGSSSSGSYSSRFLGSVSSSSSSSGEIPQPPFPREFDVWATKTIETLPDGNKKIAYCNGAGQVMLMVFRDTTTQEDWCQAYGFAGSGYTAFVADPSAVAGYDESLDELFTLRTDVGLIRHFEAGVPPTGIASVRTQLVSQGSAGVKIKIRERQYKDQAVGGVFVRALVKDTIFQSTDGDLSPATTEYVLTWHASTFQIAQRETRWPLVPSTQNGSGEIEKRFEVFDLKGRLTWIKDERGFITQNVYTVDTGALSRTIEDVLIDPNNPPETLPAGWTTPAGGGMNLGTDYESDAFGRITQALGPSHIIDLNGIATTVRRAKWTVYRDDLTERWEGRGYATGQNQAYQYSLINPAQITKLDRAMRIVATVNAIRNTIAGRLSPTDSFPQTTWVRWEDVHYDNAGRLNWRRLYVVVPSSGFGSNGTNYHQSSFDYDAMGRRIKIKSPTGTITQMVLDSRGLMRELRMGTDDGPIGNMVKVADCFYEGASGKDGALTKLRAYPSATSYRETAFTYDFRSRRIGLTGEESLCEARVYDNADRIVQIDRRLGNASGRLLARRTSHYDNRGQIYQDSFVAVDPVTGDIGNAISQLVWYDPNKRVLQLRAGTGQTLSKTIYDSLGRPSTQYVACTNNPLSYAQANTVDGDIVLRQVDFVYDGASNVIFERVRERNDDATGQGSLLGPTGGNNNNVRAARVSYTVYYPDAIGRVLTKAEFGTNGGVEPSRPAVAPASSDTCLVTKISYNEHGEAFAITDPKGTVTRKEFDAAGQIIKIIDNYVSGVTTNEANRTTEFIFNGDRNLKELIYRNAVTGDQHTKWQYGTTLADSGIATFALVRKKIYADTLGSGDEISFRYNRLGERDGMADQNGTVHAYGYDGLGRLIYDQTPVLGPGVDSAVRQMTLRYNVQGYIAAVMQSASNTWPYPTLSDEVTFTYNGFGQLVTEQQSHDGPVVNGMTPQVTYTYANGSENMIRRTSMIYPNTRVVNLYYGISGSIDWLTDRVQQIVDGGISLVHYSRRGINSTVRVQYLQPNVELTYLRQTGEPVGDGGDRYSGLDRFNRITDIRWLVSDMTTAVERYQYGFDRASNRTWRRHVNAPNTTNSNGGWDEAYTYDGLYQLTDLGRGDLNSNQTGIAAIPKWQEEFSYDPTGNWSLYQTAVNGSQTLNQARTHNKANEVIALNGSTLTVAYDPVGNMTQIPKMTDWNSGQSLNWDAWNRLVRISDSTGELARYRYDGTARRITKLAAGELRHYYYSDKWQVLEERIGDQTEAEQQFLWGQRYIDDLVLRERFGPMPPPPSSSSSSSFSSSDTSSSSESSSSSSGVPWPERLYVLHDQWHSVAIVRADGTLVERYAYTGFGQSIILAPDYSSRSTSAFDWEIRFGAYHFDHESGLYQVRYRYLHPNLGRWVSRDPISLVDGGSWLTYVSNAPANFADPKGLDPIESMQDLVNGMTGVAGDIWDDLVRDLRYAGRGLGEWACRCPVKQIKCACITKRLADCIDRIPDCRENVRTAADAIEVKQCLEDRRVRVSACLESFNGQLIEAKCPTISVGPGPGQVPATGILNGIRGDPNKLPLPYPGSK